MSAHDICIHCVCARCCFIFPLDTPISMLRCTKYKFISKSEASQKVMSEKALDEIYALSYFPTRPIKSLQGEVSVSLLPLLFHRKNVSTP